MQWARATSTGWNIGAAPLPIKIVVKAAARRPVGHSRPVEHSNPPRPLDAPLIGHYRPIEHSNPPLSIDDASSKHAPSIKHTPPKYVPEPPRPPEPLRIVGPAPSGIKEFKDERHELQQAPASYRPKKRRSAGGTLEFETNMAAFEHEDPRHHRQASSNVGYSAIKSMFRR